MSKLGEILNIKDGQYFGVKGTRRIFKFVCNEISEYNKIYEYTDSKHLVPITNVDELIWLIENCERILFFSVETSLTEQQTAAIKGRIAEGWNWIAKDDDGLVYFYETEPELVGSDYRKYFTSSSYRGALDHGAAIQAIYDFIKPRECIYLHSLVKDIK